MANRKTVAVTAPVSINLSSLPMILVDNVEIDGNYVIVTDGEATFKLPKDTTCCGRDESGAWYATANAIKKETFEAETLEVIGGDMLAMTGENFLFVPKQHVGLTEIDGSIDITEIADDDLVGADAGDGDDAGEPEPEAAPRRRGARAAEPAPAPSPRARRGR